MQYFVPGSTLIGEGRPRAELVETPRLYSDCQAVAVPDAVLEAGLRQVLSTPTNPITCADMAKLESFSFSDAGIESVEGLQLAVNLQSLELDGNRIFDLTPLAGLTELTTLNLNANWISDLAPLQGLTSLRSLGLARNYSVSVLEPLTRLTNLQTLSLTENSVTDLAPLQTLPALAFLDSSRNRINLFAPLLGNPALSEDDFLLLGYNCADLAEVAAAALQNRGASVQVEPQTPGGCVTPAYIPRVPSN